jgi:hypothetical protein
MFLGRVEPPRPETTEAQRNAHAREAREAALMAVRESRWVEYQEHVAEERRRLYTAIYYRKFPEYDGCGRRIVRGYY